MAKQSNLEKIGFESRTEQLIQNKIQKGNGKEYSADHDTAKWHEGDENHPLGKGTGNGGHLHTVPQEFNELTKNQFHPQIDTENGGGSYDVNGRPGVDGGRKWLQKINIYGPDNKYGIDSIDTDANIDEGQFFVK